MVLKFIGYRLKNKKDALDAENEKYVSVDTNLEA